MRVQQHIDVAKLLKPILLDKKPTALQHLSKLGDLHLPKLLTHARKYLANGSFIDDLVCEQLFLITDCFDHQDLNFVKKWLRAASWRPKC